jgi:glycerophosphoryl diester phosphodiesterase
MRKFSSLLLFLVLTEFSYGQVEIIAHRGASFLAPENTVASSKLAWQSGADVKGITTNRPGWLNEQLFK